MSTLRCTDPIRVTVAPGVIFDVTPRCGQCGDREGMDTQERVAAGLCILCDPAGTLECEGPCGRTVLVSSLREVTVGEGRVRDLCPDCAC